MLSDGERRAATIDGSFCGLGTMGFEQLAALKDQLAKQAERERIEKSSRGRRAAPTANTAKPGATPSKPAANTSRSGANTSANPSKPAANKSKPTDPVVLAIGKLQKRFPLAFPRKPAPKVPLKIGIFEDLVKHGQDLGLSESELREAISTWCRGTRYWTCLVDGAARVDLAGTAAGVVLPRDASRARRLRSARGPKPAATVEKAKKDVSEQSATTSNDTESPA
jgi:ProP effector